MIKFPLFVVLLLSFYLTPAAAEGTDRIVANVRVNGTSSAEVIYDEFGLAGEIDQAVFISGYDRALNEAQDASILAIADMSQPSTAKRLYILDLKNRKLLLRTYVAHGQKSGGLMADQFSNENDSHKTSLGLYRVGIKITSPKHGPALLLHGLDKGVNDNALAREVIMHGADYVSADFIKANGRLGRSWGCPAVSRQDMPVMIDLLADGALLYVHH